MDQLLDVVNRQRATILYYSIAAGFLYSWLIVPTKGVIKFHETPLSENTNDERDETDPVTTGSGLLERLVGAVRDSLGTDLSGGTPSNVEDQWAPEEGGDRAGFLRMVNRNHLLNSSNYSLSSLFSVGSVGGSVASLQGSTRSSASVKGSTRSRRKIQPSWQGPSCLHALYKMLIEPFEDYLPIGCQNNSGKMIQGRKNFRN